MAFLQGSLGAKCGWRPCKPSALFPKLPLANPACAGYGHESAATCIVVGVWCHVPDSLQDRRESNRHASSPSRSSAAAPPRPFRPTLSGGSGVSPAADSDGGRQPGPLMPAGGTRPGQATRRTNIKRWVRELASRLVAVLQGVDPETPLDAELIARVLQLMPAPAQLRVHTGRELLPAPGQRQEEPAASQRLVNVVGEAPVGATSVYSDELLAIMSHSKRGEGGAGEGASSDDEASYATSDSEGSSDEEGAPAFKWVPLIGPGTLILLLRLVADLGGIEAAQVLHTILDTVSACDAPVERSYHTRSPRSMLHFATLLISYAQYGAAEAVLGRLETAGAEGTTRPQWLAAMAAAAATGQPGLAAKVFHIMSQLALSPGADCYEALVEAHRQAGDVQEAGRVAGKMAAAGFTLTAAAQTSLAAALAAGGRSADALTMLTSLRRPSDGPVPQEGESSQWRQVGTAFMELLRVCLKPGATPGLSRQVLDSMAGGGTLISYRQVGQLVQEAEEQGTVPVVFEMFKELRRRGLIMPTRQSASTAAPQQPLLGDSDSEDVQELAPPLRHHSLPPTPTSSTTVLPSSTLPSRALGYRPSHPPTAPSAPVHQSPAMKAYTRLVTACHKARMVQEVRQLAAWLAEDGLTATDAILSRLAATLAHCDAPEEAAALYNRLLGTAGRLDSFFFNHLITAQLQGTGVRSRWPRVLCMLHDMHTFLPTNNDTHTQTSVISTAGRAGWLPELFAVYNLMLQDGIMPRPITWNALITSCSRCGRPDLGLAFFTAMREMGGPWENTTASALFSCCSSLQDAQLAQDYWREMTAAGENADTVTYNAFMHACTAGGRPDVCLATFDAWRQGCAGGGGEGGEDREGSGILSTTGEMTWSELCTALVRTGHWRQSRNALHLRRWMFEQGVDPGKLTTSALTKRAAADAPTGQWRKALKIVAALAHARGFAAAPDALSYSCAVTAAAQMGNARRAKALAEELSQLEFGTELLPYNHALDACAAAGALKQAMRLFDRLRAVGLRPDAYTWCSMLSVCTADGRLDVAEDLFSSMIAQGRAPTTITFNCILAVCAAACEPDAALAAFHRMTREFGLQPDHISYNTLVAALGRAERWPEAVEFLMQGRASGVAPTQGPDLQQMAASFPPPRRLDLHCQKGGLSVLGAGAALRAYLLLLRCALRRGKLDVDTDPHVPYEFVTGRGKNSTSGVSKLRPAVLQLLCGGGLGPPLPVSEPANQGLLKVAPREMVSWLQNPAVELGLGGEEGEERLFRRLVRRLGVAREAASPRQRGWRGRSRRR